ncbi:hypothetical protein F2P81_007555 [Scophthalmus maximus]|uniref:Sterile alpha motif domain-containing protein 3-like n=1 Tax=Scophthalmus maximus TaxID=52904 RepID=A0A6A4T5R4_SCOMX|nr:hypothetical protein F2P81_007555 [Scophthalmus maximus]
MVNKMKKRKIDWQPIQEMMTSTFSLRRKEIVEEETPVADIKARWPALFTERQIEAEFARLTSVDLRGSLFAGLDKYLLRFLEIYKARSGLVELSNLLKATDAEEDMTKGMAVGILMVAEVDDVVGFSVVLEEEIIFPCLSDFPTAVAMLMGLLFALNINYLRGLKYTFEVIQKVLMDVGGGQCSALVHGLRNRLLRKNI